MARSRNIKPGFFVNDELAEIEPLGRLLFIGLWTIADREGRLKDRPKKIKAQVLPFDNCDVDKLLKKLHEKGFILRYCANSSRYIQIINFCKHQNPHIKEAASDIPAPDKHQTSTRQEQNKHTTDPADSLLLIPDSLNPSTDSLKPSTSLIEHFFETVWALYPNKKGKGKISEAKKTELFNHGYDVIAKCIERYKATKEEWRKWQHGSTFFNSGYIDYLDENYEEPEPDDELPPYWKKDFTGKGDSEPETETFHPLAMDAIEKAFGIKKEGG